MPDLKEIKIKIILTGGGSGGHVFPLLGVFDALQKLAHKRLLSLEAMYLGPKGFGGKEFQEKGIKTRYILSGKMRRYFSVLNFLDIFKLIFGFFQSLIIVWQFMPDIVFSKGGFGSLPAVIVARIYGIPVFIHESDSIPGLSNKIASKFAQRIGVSFQRALDYFPTEKTALIGNPVHSSFFSPNSNQKTREKYYFNLERPLVLILGGSQGAQAINDLVLNSLENLIKNKIQVFHQTGENNFPQVSAEAKIILGSLPEEYRKYYSAAGLLGEQDYADLFSASSIVVGRAGSSTIFEISFFKKPSILIPLPSAASDHQRINALEYQKAGAAIVLEQKNALPNILIQEILDILNDAELARRLSEQAGRFSRPDASQKIAEEIFKLLKIEI